MALTTSLSYGASHYALDASKPIDEQYETVLTDLEKEQDILYRLEESYGKGSGSNYLKEPISKAKRKIASIEREKVRVERTLASENKKALKVNMGVMLDAYYMYNLNGPAASTPVSLRNYDREHNDFSINMAEINFDGKFRRYGFYIDLDFGEFAEQNNSSASDSPGHNVGQAYMTYEKHGYTFTFGKMYTNVGYEVAKSQENWNYSRSFAFTNTGPFWHEGITLTKGYDNGFGWGLYIYDQWDGRAAKNGEKTYSAQLNYSNDNFGIIYNYITGAEGDPAGTSVSRAGLKKTVHEVNMQYDMRENLSFAFNAVFNSDEEAGTAGKDLKKTAFVGYAHYKWWRLAFTPRIEVYTEKNTTTTAEGGTALTNSNELKFTGLTFTTGYSPREYTELRFEIRHDSADQNFYLKDDKLQKSQNTLSVAWLMKY